MKKKEMKAILRTLEIARAELECIHEDVDYLLSELDRVVKSSG